MNEYTERVPCINIDERGICVTGCEKNKYSVIAGNACPFIRSNCTNCKCFHLTK